MLGKTIFPLFARKNMKQYELKIQLKNITKPPVWRKVRVASFYTFEDLHEIIQMAMGWEASHLHQFIVGERRSANAICIAMEDSEIEDFFNGEVLLEAEVTLDQFLKNPKDKLLYEYDFGDGWEHEVTLEAVHDFDKKLVTPFVLSGKGACPPEDCGGAGGYEGLKIALENPKSPEHKSAREWMGLEKGEKYDPTEFDIDEANSDLEEFFEHIPVVKKTKKVSKSTTKMDAVKTVSKKNTKKIFVNFTNHPKSSWSKKQLDAAAKIGEVVDLPFPVISPSASPRELMELTDEYLAKFREMKATAVHVMGEMNFTFMVVFAAMHLGMPCYASTSERNVLMTKDGKKEVSFEFVQFRGYGLG